MNIISCIIRILEIPCINFSQNQIPSLSLRVELDQDVLCQNSPIVEAKIWGDLVYDIQEYYCVNDYVLIEGYFLTNVTNDSKNSGQKTYTLTIFQIYPLFFPL